MKNYLLAGLIAGAILLTAIVATHMVSPKAGEINGGANYLSSMNVVKSITVGPQVSVQVLATSTARTYAYLSATTTVPIYCNLSDASSTYPTGSGLVVNSTQPYTIAGQNLYVGSIQCSATASTTLFVTASQ